MSKGCILVVDDDRLILGTLSEGLQSAGYEVLGAGSGEEALMLVAQQTPDIALLDIRMEGMSGIELGSILFRRFAVPFLFLSAFGDEEIVRQAAEHGALGFLVKPLQVSQIIPAIEAARTRASEIVGLRTARDQLTAALEGARETSMAVGVLMERRRLNRDEAFHALRRSSRSQRRRIHVVAAELLDALEKVDLPGGGSERDEPA